MDRVRLVEVATGRVALGGLFLTSLVGNVTCTSMIAQYQSHPVLVCAFAATIFASSVLPKLPDGLTAQEASVEIGAGRSSMVVMTLLYALERAATMHAAA